MGLPNIAFCDPAAGALATALRRQLADAGKAASPLPAGAANDICVIDAGDDAITLMQLAAVLAAPENSSAPRPQIIAQLSDRMLRAAVESRLEMERIEPRPIIVSADDLVASQALLANPLFKIATWRDQPRVHAVMLGYGALGRALLEEIILDGVADGLKPPLIHIIADNARAVEAALSQELPELQECATVNFIELAADAWHSLAGPLAQIEASAPITAIFLLSQDTVFAASAAICELQDRQRIATAPLFIAGSGAAAALALTTPRRQPRNLATAASAIGGLETIDGLLGFILQGRNIIARRVHEAYEAQYANQTAAGTPWSNLAETYRRANRRAARHLSQKLFALGIDSDPAPARAHLISPTTFEKLIQPLVQSSVEDDTVRRLARLEHDRWCADRRLDGWVYGESRDEQRRRHPSLVPFDDPRLTAEEIDKDIAQLRFVLGSVVVPAEGGASVRLAVGILEQNDLSQPGITETAVLRRLDDEPDRDIVLFSPLRTPAEFSAVWTIVDHLDRQSRPFRLYITQPHAEGDHARTPELIREGRLDALLARPRTYTVPVGPAEVAAGDDWENVGPGANPADALAPAITRRADVLLNPRLSAPEAQQTSGLRS